MLVLDTEVYSNTGGQQSKATPIGASAKFAAAGKGIAKKDLGLLAMSYGHVYVAQIALQSHQNHAAQAMLEAERYPGPALVIAHSPVLRTAMIYCIRPNNRNGPWTAGPGQFIALIHGASTKANHRYSWIMPDNPAVCRSIWRKPVASAACRAA